MTDVVNVGTGVDSKDGDKARDGGGKINAKFATHDTSIATLNGQVSTLQTLTADLGASTTFGGLPLATLPLAGSESISLIQGGLNVRTPVTSFSGTPGADTVARTAITTIKSDYCDPRDFNGWDNTGVNDVSAALQSAISQAITAKVQLRIPGGLYRLNSPINFAPNGSDGIDMVGPTPAGAFNINFQTGNNGAKAVFLANFNDRPAFYGDNFRQVHMANFLVVGLNTFPQAQEMNDVKTNYITAGCRDSRYSPYCGIGIDCFNSAVPADGGYPGMTASYFGSTRDGSSQAIFECVSCIGFTVGFMLCPTGVGSQTDTMTFKNCQVVICDTGIAIGQAQSKALVFLGGNIGSCRQAFDGASYGNKTGCPPALIQGMNLGYLMRIFNMNSQVGPFLMQNCYSESIRSLGNYGTGGSTVRGQCAIQNMQFSLHVAQSLPPPVLFETFGIASIRSMNFGVDSGVSSHWNMANDMTTPILIESSTFGNATAGNVAIVGLLSTGSGVEMHNCLSQGNGAYQTLTDISDVDVSTMSINGRWSGPLRGYLYANGTGEVVYTSPNTAGNISAAATGTAFTNRAITFTGALALGATTGTLTGGGWTDLSGWYNVTFSNSDVRTCLFANGSTAVKWGSTGLSSSATTAATAACVAMTFTATDVTLFLAGDVIFWKMLAVGGSGVQRTVPAWVVTNIAGSVVTCQPKCDVTYYDTVANNGGGTTLLISQNQWAPSVAFTGNSNTSTSLTGVSPTNLIQNGDWLNNAIPGLAANTRVVAGAGTATLTLNKATSTSAALTLYFGRFQTPTTTAAW